MVVVVNGHPSLVVSSSVWCVKTLCVKNSFFSLSVLLLLFLLLLLLLLLLCGAGYCVHSDNSNEKSSMYVLTYVTLRQRNEFSKSLCCVVELYVMSCRVWPVDRHLLLLLSSMLLFIIIIRNCIL